MEIILYRNISSDNTVNKSLTTVKTVAANLLDTTNNIRPVLTFAMDGNINGINYIHIPGFNRYYFITDIQTVSNNRYTITCMVDVLKTYVPLMGDISGIVERQSVNANYFVTDNKYPIRTDRQVVTKVFPQGFSGSGAILMTVSGG